ncbi:MAG: hypothetical protein R8G66_31580 [Cytophagales bacterium]|nr:hypothetical protein [Cytophagales bacterium]
MFAAIAFVCQSCSLDQDKSIALEDIDFDTRDDTELFFKNIRQSSYHLEENKPASINIFRLKDNPLDSNSLEPNPIIIHHWLRDKAYLWLEIGGVSNFDEPLEFTVAYPESEEVLKFDGASPKNHTEVALALFNACLSEATITCNGNKILAPNTSSKTNYQLIMNDYFRLLGLK